MTNQFSGMSIPRGTGVILQNLSADVDKKEFLKSGMQNVSALGTKAHFTESLAMDPSKHLEGKG